MRACILLTLLAARMVFDARLPLAGRELHELLLHTVHTLTFLFVLLLLFVRLIIFTLEVVVRHFLRICELG